MHSSVATRKKTRSRSKSMGSNNSTSKVVEDSNLNGENVTEKESVEAMEVDKTDDTETKTDSKTNTDDAVKLEVKVDKPAKGRKRKASEMKSNNSISEEPPAKDKPSENEKGDDDIDVLPVESQEVNEDSSKDDADTPDDKLQSKDVSAMRDSSDSSSHDVDILGKGKRARIPNKRYSDFPLKTPTKLNFNEHESQLNLENGEMKENIDSESNTDASEHSGSATESPGVANIKSSRANVSTTSASSPSTSSMKKKPTINLNNPNYLKPFHFGWKRELVYRSTLDAAVGKRNGDIYYYTPNGRKVRSMREVSEHLKNKELTLDDFTFTKEPLGLDDPEKEIIRDAKNKSATGTPLIKKLTPKITKTPKANSPQTVSTPNARQEEKESKTKERELRVKSAPVLGGFKIKLTRGASAKSKSEKKNKDDTGEDTESEYFTQDWHTEDSKKTNKTRKSTAAKKTRRSSKPPAPVVEPVVGEEEDAVSGGADTKPKSTYFQNVSFGYNTLLYVFQYLKVSDLLRATSVCSMWRDIASHNSLWRTLRLKNSQVHSFEGLANALQKHGTRHLDLRKMLLPNAGSDDIWQEFSREIKKVDTLKKIELCRCPATVVEQLALTNPKLEVINALTIKCDSISLAPLVFLKSVKELRLKSITGFSLTSDLIALSDLQELTHLSLTSIKDLYKHNIEVIADLKNLESLDLGECSDFPKTFGGNILARLDKLERLRLEKGQNNCYAFEMLDAIKNMPKLEQLELVNFDIKAGFDRALGACTNIKKLLVIPTYISQSATTNHMVLGGVLRLQNNLSHFVWGITLELLRVTELFVDQCEDADKKEKKEKKPSGNGESIPVLKPVPLLKEGAALDNILPAQDPPQVEILPLPNLQKLLLQNLPTTRVKILKIPFHATWRQTITDTVN